MSLSDLYMKRIFLNNLKYVLVVNEQFRIINILKYGGLAFQFFNIPVLVHCLYNKAVIFAAQHNT